MTSLRGFWKARRLTTVKVGAFARQTLAQDCKRMGRMVRTACVLATLSTIGLAGVNSDAKANAVTSKPVSRVVVCGDSAYQMVKATTDAGRSGVRWAEAQAEARRITHEGQRGRLAIIPNMQVHACVSERLVPKAKEEAWIGLRYWCPYRQMQWTTGEIREHGKPSPWAPKWSRYGTCQTQYVGVYYTPASKRWQAVEATKRFRYMLVEYPPSKSKSQQQAEQ